MFLPIDFLHNQGEGFLVEKSLAKKLYEEEKKAHRLVLYLTTNSVIRTTFDACASIIKLFEYVCPSCART